jgi:hypothetical protein
MEHPPNRAIGSYYIQFPIISQGGISLIALIGILAVITIGLSLVTPTLVQIWDRRHQETERFQLRRIADGIQTYLEQNKVFPPSLASLVPDYVPFPAAQLTTNARGFPRYYAVHPAMAGLNNSTGLSAAELVDTRFLLITNLTQDAAPPITTPAEFETWWTTDESLIPNLHIHRGNVGHLFYSLAITPEGNGASFFISTTPATDSGGGLLPTHNAFHLVGTTIGFDEATTYTLPEVQFALTTNTAYWFDPICTATKQWNPLNPFCDNVRDEFNAIAFNGNDGTHNWVNDWQETGESDGPTSGKMQVVTDAQCAAGNCFQIGGGGMGPPTSVSREVDLSGATIATLTFSYRRSAGGNGGNVRLKASGNGGTTWTILQTYFMDGSDANQVPQTFDLTPYIAPNTQIQFQRVNNLNRLFYADNVDIAWN